MINYGKVKNKNLPPEIEITPNYIYVAKNIQTIEETIEGETEISYTYDYYGYTKDEYYTNIINDNLTEISRLTDELAAAKILLGVD